MKTVGRGDGKYRREIAFYNEHSLQNEYSKIFQMIKLLEKQQQKNPHSLLLKRALVSFGNWQHQNQASEKSHSAGAAGPPVRLLPQSSVCIFRSDEFRGGSSGTTMSCRLGMLTTMRRCAPWGAEDFRLAIFSIVGLLGLRSIPSILGGKTQHLVDTATVEAQA